MAKQDGPIILRRTIDNLCFYIRDGVALLRMKPGLTRKQMMNSKRFRRTMESAGRMRRGSKIASRIYGALPEGWKHFCMYRVIVGEAVRMVKAGKTDEEAYSVLWERYLAEFVPGYWEEEEFVHASLVKPQNVATQQGHKIQKHPLKSIPAYPLKSMPELRPVVKNKHSRPYRKKLYHEIMDG